MEHTLVTGGSRGIGAAVRALLLERGEVVSFTAATSSGGGAILTPDPAATDWSEVLDRFLGVGWMHRLGYPGIWEKIRDIPDHIFWSVRQDIKARMLHMVRHRLAVQHTRNHGSESHLERLLRYADPAKPHVLTIGFGRRFATYKRATLLFNDMERLRRIVSDRERPTDNGGLEAVEPPPAANDDFLDRATGKAPRGEPGPRGFPGEDAPAGRGAPIRNSPPNGL